MTYAAPIGEQAFVLDTIAGIDSLATLPSYSAVDSALVTAILEEGGRMTSEVFGR